MDEFGDEILFLNVDGQTPEVTVSRAALDSTTVVRDKNAVLKQAAEYLREEIMSYAANYKASWPPTCDSLKEEEKDYPSILNEFFTCVLKSKDPPCSDSIKRLISSYGYHLIHGVTRGKVVTLKHFVLGVGLHNITGLKLPIRVLSHLGHCIDYDLVCDIETAEAEVAQKMYENDLTQLTQISATEAPILTYWWADNFNQTLESYCGHGVINSTHIVEFSEPEETAAMLDISLKIPRNKKRRSLVSSNSQNLPSVMVDKKKEPTIVSTAVSETAKMKEEVDYFDRFYAIWALLRPIQSSDQSIPAFSGWSVRMQQKAMDDIAVQKTQMTYLPPVNSPFTKFATMSRVFEIIQEQAKKKNMKYANITLDIGAALNAFKVLWNYPDKFENIVIHLGDFHYMKEIFAILGQLVSGSGFEDIIFQAGLCSAGSLNGVVAGSHYNRCWTVHNNLTEALERLLFERFLSPVDNLRDLVNNISDRLDLNYQSIEEHFQDALEDDGIGELLKAYSRFQEDVRNGVYGKTSQFWMLYYLDIMRNQHLIRESVHTNNFFL